MKTSLALSLLSLFLASADSALLPRSPARAVYASGRLCQGAKFKLGDKPISSFNDLSRYFSYYSLIPKIDTSELVTLEYRGPTCGSFRNNMSFYLRAGTRDLRRFRSVFQYDNYNFFTRLFRSGRDSVRTVLDLGAHTGMSTMFFAADPTTAQVVAVEPNLDDFALLRLNTFGYTNVFLEYGAAWDSSSGRGTTVKVGKDSSQTTFTSNQVDSSVAETKSVWQQLVVDVMDLSTGKLGEIVPSISVQAVMDKYKWQTIDFLKVDVSGAERVIFGDPAAKDTWLRKVRCFGIRMSSVSVAGSSMRMFLALEKELKLQRPRFKTGDMQVWCKPEALLDVAG